MQRGSMSLSRPDVSLLKVVDEVCWEIKRKETMANLLVLSTGSMIFPMISE